MGIGSGMRFTSNRRTYHIADAKNGSSLFLGQLQGGQGICCFTGLTDGNHHVLLRNNGVAVTELRSILHLNRHACQVFKNIFSYQPGMPGGTTSDDNKTICIEELVMVIKHPAHLDHAFIRQQTATQGILYGLGLFVDLFEHEVGIPALFNGFKIHFELVYIRINGLITFNGTHLEFFAFLYYRHFIILKVNRLFGIFQKRSGITGNEEFILTDTHHQWTTFFGYHDLIRILNTEYRYGIGSDNLV